MDSVCELRGLAFMQRAMLLDVDVAQAFAIVDLRYDLDPCSSLGTSVYQRSASSLALALGNPQVVVLLLGLAPSQVFKLPGFLQCHLLLEALSEVVTLLLLQQPFIERQLTNATQYVVDLRGHCV